MTDETVLRAKVQEEPGDPAFVDLADLLRERGNPTEAMMICFAGLSANRLSHRGRLVLARIFYELKLFPFAIRELEELHAVFPQNTSIEKLLSKLSPGRGSQSEKTPDSADEPEQEHEETVAEAEFDFDEIDLLDEDDEN